MEPLFSEKINMLKDQSLSHRVCIAPMVNWTDRHYRYIMRLITKKTMLYTEMISTDSIIHGARRDKLLYFSPEERPITLQLGGNRPKDLVHCARIAEDLGFSEINLNLGCPSNRVLKGNFGLSLMYKPQLVNQCVYAMRNSLSIPVSIKCRTGVDKIDDFNYLKTFIAGLIDSGADFICVHARKGWLTRGLSPAQNRSIPPLNYEMVYKIKSLFPNTEIGINGGIHNLQHIKLHLRYVDSVMIGREAYRNPLLFKDVDENFYDENPVVSTPFDIVEGLMEYIEKEMRNNDCKLSSITRHALNIFNGYPNARLYRQYLSENAPKNNDATAAKVFKEAVNLLT